MLFPLSCDVLQNSGASDDLEDLELHSDQNQNEQSRLTEPRKSNKVDDLPAMTSSVGDIHKVRMRSGATGAEPLACVRLCCASNADGQESPPSPFSGVRVAMRKVKGFEANAEHSGDVDDLS